MTDIEFKPYKDSDSSLWEEINLKANGSFLTSVKWIEFQKQFGKNTEQFLIYYKDKLIGNLYIEIVRRRFAKYAYSPYGPVVDWDTFIPDLSCMKENKIKCFFKSFQKFQKDFIQKQNLNLFRIDPLLPASYREELLNLGYKKSLSPTQAKDTTIINLELSEEELQKNLAKVARYNIKKSKEAGFEVIKVKTNKEFENFLEILFDTFVRKNFATYGKEYFEKQFEMLNGDLSHIFLTKYKGRYLSAALINTYNQNASYAHGGSINDAESQKFGATYLLQWEIIKFLKQNNFKTYNLWGILPDYVQSHPMKGVSDFKKRFGGDNVSYVGGLDIYANLFRYSMNRLLDFYAYRNDRY